MISKKLANAINTQLNFEFESAHVYLALAAFAEDHNYPGAGHWFRKQYHEETEHALKFIKFLTSVGEKVTITGFETPKAEFEGFVALFETALAHERKVTANIRNLIDIAQENKDHAAISTLNWYISEQIEEEENLLNILNRLALTDNSPISIVMMDDRLASR